MIVDCQQCWTTYESSSTKRGTRPIQSGRAGEERGVFPDHTRHTRDPVRVLEKLERPAVLRRAGRSRVQIGPGFITVLRRQLRDAKVNVQATEAESWANGADRPILLMPKSRWLLQVRTVVLVDSNIETVLYNAGLREAVVGYTPGYEMEILRRRGDLKRLLARLQDGSRLILLGSGGAKGAERLSDRWVLPPCAVWTVSQRIRRAVRLSREKVDVDVARIASCARMDVRAVIYSLNTTGILPLAVDSGCYLPDAHVRAGDGVALKPQRLSSVLGVSMVRDRGSLKSRLGIKVALRRSGSACHVKTVSSGGEDQDEEWSEDWDPLVNGVGRPESEEWKFTVPRGVRQTFVGPSIQDGIIRQTWKARRIYPSNTFR